ncbi:MAG: 23S rRNA (pseudouridine(1915)-N(3))-methyltransferase RlmH [Candidatus Cloacimonadaceae bacterium]|nr:23S rRNA (pseudouridine(1915)-N(3))-methyltransferase RlmH [Candidatus Cloacimonadaceae bacterium]
MTLCIVQLGKTKDSWLKTALEEYHKRIAPYTRFEIIELPDTPITKVANIDSLKQKEAEKLLRQINAEDYVVVLDERGIQKKSLEFASFLHNLYCMKRVVFVIGGVYGTSQSLRDRANTLFSLSELTFTHQMVRVILAEQIYRALTIINNKAYHY